MATLGARLWSRGAFRHSPNAFILASMVSGFAWYFTSQRCKDITNQKKELIRRVQSGETAENFKSTFDYHKAEDFECRKVNLDGILGQGRFFVKRSRGKQEGYYVLAPFTVNAYHTEHNIISPEKFHMHTIKRKFILNLGWIPRSRKHLVYENFPSDFIPEELCADRQEAMEKQRKDGIIRDPLIPDILAPVTNVTAYVRRGQVQDKVNGRVNQQERYLYKWIDLNLLTRAFRVFNEEEGETVYLDRAVKTADQPESFPLVATKESLIEDLNTQIKHSQKYANVAAKGISGLAFGAAAWITFF